MSGRFRKPASPVLVDRKIRASTETPTSRKEQIGDIAPHKTIANREEMSEFDLSYEEVQPPKNYSPRKLVIGVGNAEEPRPVSDLLTSNDFELHHSIRGEKDNYLLAKTAKNQSVYIRSPHKKDLQRESRVLEKVTRTPYNVNMRRATLKTCQSECSGVALVNPETLVMTFVNKDTTESFLVTPDLLSFQSYIPIPIIDLADVLASPYHATEIIGTVTNRLTNYIKAECDKTLDKLLESYLDFYSNLQEFMSLSDAAVEDSSNGFESVIDVCSNAEGMIEKIQEVNELLKLSSNQLRV
jgi:hypothetical protein